ncbi:hypothetical protein ACOME3_008722 [Neoechinorhynchus agilis]
MVIDVLHISNFLFMAFTLSNSFTNCKYALWEKKVPYCRDLTTKCSQIRNDLLFVPYYDSKCYCDFFCEATNPSSDCCPDFDIICKLNPTVAKTCLVDGKEVEIGQSVILNAISCQCDKRYSWFCHGDALNDSLSVDEAVIKSINKINYLNSSEPTWRAGIYKSFLGKTVGHLRRRVFGSSQEVKHSLQFYEHDPGLHNFLPIESFDLRKLSWPIGRIRNQKTCPISHIVSAVDVAADRFARQPHMERIWNRTFSPLSIQFPLSCGKVRECDVKEIDLDNIWNFLNRFGAVKEECYPYSSGQDKYVDRCAFPYERRIRLMLGGQTMPVMCKDNRIKRDLVFRFGPAYRLYPSVKDVQYELVLRGAVQGTMLACPDFIFYRSGIYAQSIKFRRSQCNYHSVRILGWSSDHHNRLYWICANSWGTSWGEKGYFRIYAGQCEIEQHVITTWGHAETYYPIDLSFAK